jgi:glycosyltransferase involved in cell wall biosynthesis
LRPHTPMEFPVRAEIECQSDSLDVKLSKSTASYVRAKPLVSVIIPCYNGERYLRQAIQSALGQDYPRVEVIVVDDGSTDRSSTIAHQYPVRYLHQQNRGLSGARNSGIRISRGIYLAFLDADDRLRPEAISAGVRLLEHRPDCAMAVGDHVFISEDGSHATGSRKDCLSAFHYEALLKSNFVEVTSSALFRRSVFDRVGHFDTRLRVAEDYDLYLRIAKEHAICCHSTVVAEYRIHRGTLSSNSELMLVTTLDVLKSQAPYICNVRRLVSFNHGLHRWRRLYGRRLTLELARSSPEVSLRDRLRKVRLLCREYPLGLLALIPLRIAAALPRPGS